MIYVNEDQLWDKFFESGKVKDYLKYKHKQGGMNRADNGKRAGTSREGIWRE